MASSVLLINIKGEVLIYRCYKYDVSRQETLEFIRKIISTKEAKEKPIIYMNGVSYIHTSENEITLLATSKSNVNVAMIFNFLYALINLAKSYFGEFSETSIKNNFGLMYELMDEIMDYGYPQVTDPDILKKFILQEGLKNDWETQAKLKEYLTQLTGTVSWRAQDIYHPSNEVYIDVIENVNILISKTGEIIKSEVMGQVQVKSLLSGWPECKFGMNDKLQIAQSQTKSSTKGISIEDIRFHQCVRLSDFNKDRTITFIPPDGLFELMKYRVTENIIIPFKVYCNIIETPIPDNPSISQSIDLDINLKALFDRLLYAQDVVIKVQIPKNATGVKTHSSVGKAKFETDKGAIIWRIKKLFGDKECKLKCEIPLIPVKDPVPWARAPISMDFQIPMFTSSGLRVRFLKITEQKMNYRPVKWIRYLSKAGDFQFRI